MKPTRIAGASRVTELALKAKEIFEQNVNTHVAMFLIRHPDIDPADVVLRMASGEGGKMDFSIEAAKLYVPSIFNMDISPLPSGMSPVSPEGCAYADGWNACRQAMLDARKAATPPMSMNTPLADVLDSMFMPEDEARDA